MKDLSYALENLKRVEVLRMHLSSNFYPPIPGSVKSEFVAAFTEYWEGKLSVPELDAALRERAGYIGGLGKYDFWQFLNQEDLED